MRVCGSYRKMCEAKQEQIKKVLMEVFEDIDKDKSGFLDQAELESVIKAYIDHPECPAESKAEYDSPEKIKDLCEVCSFYRAMLLRERLCHGTSSVCLVVRLSATIRYRDHIGWNTSVICGLLLA